MSRHRFTKEQIEYLRRIGDALENKVITQVFNKKFNTNLTREQITGAKWRNNIPSIKGEGGRFEKRSIPWNKGLSYMPANGETRFQKGHTSNIKRQVGAERVCVKDDYIIVKTAQPNTWEHKHRVEWKKHNGEIPEGHTIIFGDKDNRNFDIDNLICVSRKQLLGLNKHDLIKDHAELTRAAINIVDLNYKITERSK